MCINDQAVNCITRKDRYPFPHIEELFQPLGCSNCISKIDLASGYHQIRICAGDRQKTAFSTKYVLYAWTLLPFGLANAPSQFMRVMNRLLASNPGLRKFVAIYLDDVLINSSTTEEHLDHLRIVLDLLQKAGLKLKRSKCEWFRDEIEFCGFQINQEGGHTFNSKTQTVTEWPRPRNTKAVHGFLGLMGYCRKFIWHYAHIPLPLYRMCKISKKFKMGGRRSEPRLKDVGRVQFVWNGEAEEAFETLKDAMCKAPVLALPEEEGEYMLHSDASKYAVGAVLSQKRQDGETRVIAFWSRKLKSAET
jgi:hypothetical protein